MSAMATPMACAPRCSGGCTGPAPATLPTGLRRDIALIELVHAKGGDEVNLFDLSMQRDRVALLDRLDAGVQALLRSPCGPAGGRSRVLSRGLREHAPGRAGLGQHRHR